MMLIIKNNWTWQENLKYQDYVIYDIPAIQKIYKNLSKKSFKYLFKKRHYSDEYHSTLFIKYFNR